MRLILNIKVDLKKASTAEAAEEFYMNLINKHIIYSDEVNVRGMIKDLQEFQENIKESILKGEKTFLPNGSVKEMGAYKDPTSNQSVKATLAWNMLCPDQMIEIPAKVSLVKLNIFKEEDIKDLKDTYPEKYELIIDKIFNDKTGMFVKVKMEPITKIKKEKNQWWLDLPQKYRTKYKEKGIEEWNAFVEECEETGADMVVKTVNKQGLQSIAIPSNTEIPEWLQPYIDYGTMINNILSPFEPVLKIFKVRTIEEGKSINGVNRKTEAISNIIKF